MKFAVAATAAALALTLPAFAANTNPPSSSHEHAISMNHATRIALAKEPGTIKSKELEHEKGLDIYSFDIRTKSAIHEVNVNADTGAIVEDSIETKATEATEKQQDAMAKHHHRVKAETKHDDVPR